MTIFYTIVKSSAVMPGTSSLFVGLGKFYYFCIQKVYLDCPDAANCTINKIKSSPATWVGLVTFKGADCHNHAYSLFYFVSFPFEAK